MNAEGGKKMRLENMEERAINLNYALLASQIVLTLEDLMEGKEIIRKKEVLLNEGEKLLSKIVEGAAFVEKKESLKSISPTLQGLSIYGYALSTVEKLDLLKKQDGFTEFFLELHKDIQELKQNRKNRETVDRLKNFFLVLGNLLRVDIQKQNYPKETLPFAPKDDQSQ